MFGVGKRLGDNDLLRGFRRRERVEGGGDKDLTERLLSGAGERSDEELAVSRVVPVKILR